MYLQFLETDRLRFESEHSSAAAFVIAASLRRELFSLLSILRASTDSYSESSLDWATKRISELKKAPACREPWFVDKLVRERLIEEGDL